MLTGHVISIGDIDADGETVTGLLIECDREQLKNYGRNLVFKNVVVCEQDEGVEAERKPCSGCECERTAPLRGAHCRFCGRKL